MVIVQYRLPGDLIFQVRRSSFGNFIQHQQPFQPWQYELYSPTSPTKISPNFLKNDSYNSVCSSLNNPFNEEHLHFVSRIGPPSITAHNNNNKQQDVPLVHCSTVNNIILNSPTSEKPKTLDNKTKCTNIKNFASEHNFNNSSDMKPQCISNVQPCSLISDSVVSRSPDVFIPSQSKQCDNERKSFDGEWGAKIKIPKNSANVIRLRVNFLNDAHQNEKRNLNGNFFTISKSNARMNDPNFIYSSDKDNVTDCSDKLASCSADGNNCQSPLESNNSVLLFDNSHKNFSQFESSNNENDFFMPLLRKPEEIDSLSDIDKLNQVRDGRSFDKKCSSELSPPQWNNGKSESTMKCSKKDKNNMAKQKCKNKRKSVDALLSDKFSFITKDNVFDVNLTKTSRGLGLSICGGWDTDPANLDACLIRIKRLYPLHPAYACGKLKIGDIILSVNGRNLTGLSYAEAIEILRMASSDVKLTICRPEEGILPPIPENSRLIINSLLDANSDQTDSCPPFTNVQYMEFDITLTKVAGSLGFTIGKDEEENSSHYIKDLVKEPALSCGDIQSGDKIILVNGVDISDMSHSEAIAFFRSLPDEVTLCLWRQVLPVSSPLSPLSPTMPFFSEEEKKNKPKPLLRKEALDMLSDKARLKKDKKINSSPKSHKEDHSEQDLVFENVNKKENTIDCNTTVSEHSINEKNKCISSSSSGIASNDSSSQNTELYCETDSSGCSFDILDPKLNESDYIHINAARSPSFTRDVNEISHPGKPQRPSFLDLSSDNLSPRKQKYGRSFVPTSPQETNSENLDSDFKTSDSNDSLSATDNPNTATSSEISPLPFTTQDSALMKWRGMTLNGEDEKTDFYTEMQMKSSQLTVELDRRWNSRLGFSLVTLDTGEIPAGIYVKFIYPGSLAALDGRLQAGDRLIKVNDDHVTGLSVQEVIDLLRKSQGKVAITVERIPDNFHRQLSNSSADNVLSRSQSENESLLSNEITAMNVKNNNINRLYRWEASSTSPVDNESYNDFVNLKV